MKVLALLLAAASLASAQVTTHSTTHSSSVATRTSSSASSSSTASGAPCAVASEAISKLTSDFRYIPANVAYDCLVSVPVDVRGNTQLIEELKTLLSWESDLTPLKNAPNTYDRGPVDLLGELDKIKGNLTQFRSEYDVHIAIRNLVDKTGNFHLNWNADITSNIFIFERGVTITSVSDDGKVVPKVYVTRDLQARHKEGNSVEISPISQINGQDVTQYLDNLASRENYLDGDARYNRLMWLSNDTSSFGSFSDANAYDGPSTNVTFTNSTSKSYHNWAFVRKSVDFKGVTSGESFFTTFCLGPADEAQLKTKREVNGLNLPNPVTPQKTHLHKRANIPSDYPQAVVIHSANSVGGYYLDNEVAVLKIPTFSPDGKDDAGIEFQSIVKQFLGNATKDGRTKLIVDLRENGGGNTNLLLDTFMQLFPTMQPYSAQRYRATETFQAIGGAVSQIYTNAELNQKFSAEAGGYDLGESFRFWAYWHFVTESGANFKDWAEFYGPRAYDGDEFTTLMRYNMSNSDRVSVLPEGFNFITGGQQPFATENVVMFTDGLCGSACASFHEEMKNIAGVKTIAIGGRPKTGAMQGVGGTKGGEVIGIDNIPQYAQAIINITDTIGATALHNTGLPQLANVTEVLKRTAYSSGAASSRINTQDQLRKGDKSGTPLQFIYEAADCRLFYTSDMLFNPTEAWNAVKTAAFGDKSNCVQDSTGQSSSISGGFKPYGNAVISSAVSSWKPASPIALAVTIIVAIALA